MSQSIKKFVQPCSHILQLVEKENSIGNLFLGDINCLNTFCLKEHKIQSILTIMASEGHEQAHFRTQIQNSKIAQHLWFHAQDNLSQKINEYFQQSFEFITENLKKGNVLVHCRAGASRSATIVIYYIMRIFNYNLDESYNYVAQRRSIIDPNQNFMELLEEEQINIRRRRCNSNCPRILVSKNQNIQYNLFDGIGCNRILNIKNQFYADSGNIYLGNASIIDKEVLNYYKIKSVVLLLDQRQLLKMQQSLKVIPKTEFNLIIFVIQQNNNSDKFNQHEIEMFDSIFNFINEEGQNKNIAICSYIGISRNAMAMCAYLMRKYKISWSESYNFILRNRPISKFDSSMKRKLIQFSQK